MIWEKTKLPLRWITKKQQNLFKRTANSPLALGDLARHGWTNETPPEDPMKLKDAKSLINKVVTEWLNLKRRIMFSSLLSSFQYKQYAPTIGEHASMTGRRCIGSGWNKKQINLE